MEEVTPPTTPAASEVQSPVVRRRGLPRSRNGCSTCHRRKVKCDEQRPKCGSCVRMQLPCVYAVRTDASSRLENPRSQTVDVLANTEMSRYQIPFTFSGRSDDRKALHYYFNYAAVNLSNYSANYFWETLVAQACVGNNVVTNCVIALGRAHLFRTGPKVDADPCAALSNLHAQAMAVMSLRRYLKADSPSASIVLTCCILLSVTGKISGRPEEVQVHLDEALKILRQNGNDVEAEITRQLLVLDLEASVADRSRTPSIDTGLLRSDRLTFPLLDLDEPDPPPLRLESGDHAVFHRHMIHRAIWTFTTVNKQYRGTIEIPDEILEEWTRIGQHLRVFREALEEYDWQHGVSATADRIRLSKGSLPPSDISGKALLDGIRILTCKAYRMTGKRFLLESIGSPDSPPWDHNPKKILQTAERALVCINAYKTRFLPDGPIGSFTTHVGVDVFLRGLAYRTSDPAVRARCEELLDEYKEVLGFMMV